jgi:hypothetical protein
LFVEWTLVVAIMTAAALWLTRPLAVGLWDKVLNFGDAIHPVFILDHNYRVMSHWDWGHYWNAPMFTPYPYSTALADPHLGTALWTWPAYWASSSALFAHNLAIIGSFILTGVACYVLASQFTTDRWLALAVGVAAMAIPFRLAQIEHMHLAMTQWLPLSLWSLIVCVRRSHGMAVVAFGLSFLLTLLSSVYYGLFQLLLFVPLAAVLGMRYQWYRPTVMLRPWLWTILGVAVASGVFLLPFYLVTSAGRFDRQLENVELGSAQLRDFLNVTARHWSRHVPGLRVGPVELTLFPGFLLSFGAMLSLVRAARSVDWRTRVRWQVATAGRWLQEHRDIALGMAGAILILYAWLAHAPFNVWVNLKHDFMPLPWTAVSRSFLLVLIVALLAAVLPRAIRSGWFRDRGVTFWCWCGIAMVAVLSMGPVIRAGTADVTIGPYALLYRYMPGFQHMQVPGRLNVLLLPLLAILCTTAFREWIETQPSTMWRVGVAVVTCLLLAADLAVSPLTLHALPLEADLPNSIRWLRDQAEPGGVLVLPTDTIARQRSPLYLYYALYHRHPILNGYASFVPPDCAAALQQVRSFPSAGAIETLRQRGVRYVVLDRVELALDMDESSVAERLRECDASEAAHRVAIEGDERFVVYEL